MSGLGPEYPIPDQYCPRCGHQLTESNYVGGDRKPEPGNVSLCIECGDIRIFDDCMQLRAPTDTELTEISTRPDIIQLQIYISSLNHKKKGTDDRT